MYCEVCGAVLEVNYSGEPICNSKTCIDRPQTREDFEREQRLRGDYIPPVDRSEDFGDGGPPPRHWPPPDAAPAPTEYDPTKPRRR